MRSRIAFLLACLALAVAAWAGDPWKEKSFKEWDEKEVNKILGDSPWARVISVPAFWRSGGDSVPRVGGRSGGAAASGEGGTSGGTASASGEGGGGGMSEAHFTLRWGSARTSREALVRLAVLRGTPAAEAEKFLGLALTEHQLVLLGNDMSPFAKSDEKSLMEKTFLKMKKTKLKISPTRVEIKRSQDGKKISGILFYFSMKSNAGEPIIAPDEKGVEFECRNEQVNIRAGFEPQKMVNKAGPDLQ